MFACSEHDSGTEIAVTVRCLEVNHASCAHAGDRVEQYSLLAALVRGAALVGGVAAAFGPAFSYTLLRLAYGQRWSETEAPAALAAYSIYILLLAVNGILEVLQAINPC